MNQVLQRQNSASTLANLEQVVFSQAARVGLFSGEGKKELTEGLFLELDSNNRLRVIWHAGHGTRVRADSDSVFELSKLAPSADLNPWDLCATILGNYRLSNAAQDPEPLRGAFLQGLFREGYTLDRIDNVQLAGVKMQIPLSTCATISNSVLGVAANIYAHTLNMSQVVIEDAQLNLKVELGRWESVVIKGKKCLITGSVGKVDLDQACMFTDCTVRADFSKSSVPEEVFRKSSGYSFTTGLSPATFQPKLVTMDSKVAAERSKVLDSAKFAEAKTSSWHKPLDKRQSA